MWLYGKCKFSSYVCRKECQTMNSWNKLSILRAICQILLKIYCVPVEKKKTILLKLCCWGSNSVPVREAECLCAGGCARAGGELVLLWQSSVEWGLLAPLWFRGLACPALLFHRWQVCPLRTPAPDSPEKNKIHSKLWSCSSEPSLVFAEGSCWNPRCWEF